MLGHGICPLVPPDSSPIMKTEKAEGKKERENKCGK
jgi:hypothetical protein